MGVQTLGWEKDWVDLAQKRDGWRSVVHKCGNEPSGSIKCGEYLD
jgi:hypothetical protein